MKNLDLRCIRSLGWNSVLAHCARGDRRRRQAECTTDSGRLGPILARDDIPAFVQAAIAHAQFETIHPFPDGNGRAGRALIHALLRAKGVTQDVTVPVSAGLLTVTRSYSDALTTYRQGDPGVLITLMSDAATTAMANGRQLLADQAMAGNRCAHRARRLCRASRTAHGRRRLTCGARTVKGVRVTNDNTGTGNPEAPAGSLEQLEQLASGAINDLAQQTDPEAFQALLRLSALVGEALGVSARTLATTGSWAKVAEAAGTSRQAAWSRWSS